VKKKGFRRGTDSINKGMFPRKRGGDNGCAGMEKKSISKHLTFTQTEFRKISRAALARRKQKRLLVSKKGINRKLDQR